VPQGSS
jgi:hypothetical protein